MAVIFKPTIWYDDHFEREEEGRIMVVFGFF
jgi:hypothetical protein